MELLEKNWYEIKKLGLDALDSGWTKENFYQKMHNNFSKRFFARAKSNSGHWQYICVRDSF